MNFKTTYDSIGPKQIKAYKRWCESFVIHIARDKGLELYGDNFEGL